MEQNMFSTKTTASLCFSLVIVLGACAQQVEPPRITPQPIYNKHGDVVGCEGGGQYDTASQQENPCLPPEDECTYTPGSNYPCEPWHNDDDPQRPEPQQPTGPTTGPVN